MPRPPAGRLRASRPRSRRRGTRPVRGHMPRAGVGGASDGPMARIRAPAGGRRAVRLPETGSSPGTALGGRPSVRRAPGRRPGDLGRRLPRPCRARKRKVNGERPETGQDQGAQPHRKHGGEHSPAEPQPSRSASGRVQQDRIGGRRRAATQVRHASERPADGIVPSHGGHQELSAGRASRLASRRGQRRFSPNASDG